MSCCQALVSEGFPILRGQGPSSSHSELCHGLPAVTVGRFPCGETGPQPHWDSSGKGSCLTRQRPSQARLKTELQDESGPWGVMAEWDGQKDKRTDSNPRLWVSSPALSDGLEARDRQTDTTGQLWGVGRPRFTKEQRGRVRAHLGGPRGCVTVMCPGHLG